MKCFVIMPFGDARVDAKRARKLDSIYSDWIKRTVESITFPDRPDLKITCHRGDKTFRPGEVITHIIENLLSADIVIADLSGKNPNVFYELGVRHAVGNNCILLSDNVEDVPFDLRPLRTIIYEYEPESMLRLKTSLEQAILEILRDPDTLDNPVRRYIYQRESDRSVREQVSPQSEFVKSLLAEIALLRKDFMEQSGEMRKMMKLITSAPESVADSQPALEIDVKSFEGIWKDTISQSTFYVRVVDGELLAPYRFGGDPELTAHLYNCKVFGETLLGRFEWFEVPISGYIFLRRSGADQINGGWWFEEDVPSDAIREITRVSGNLPNMNRLSLVRETPRTNFPPFVEKYFTERYAK